MQLTHEKFYYNYGIRKPFQLLEPTVLQLPTILLPHYSAIHMLNVTDDYYPTRIRPMLTNVHDAIVLNKLNYEPMIHKATELTIKERTYVKDLNKKYVDFTTYTRSRFNQILIHKKNILKTTVPVFIYKDIDKFYRYPESMLSKINRFENKYATIAKNIHDYENTFKAMNIKNNAFKQYVVIELPNMLYDYNIIKKFLAKNKDAEYLNLFHNETYMLMLEFFKLINSETQSNSILKELVGLQHVDIIFKNKASAVIVNLKTLLSFNKDINENGSYDNNTLSKYIVNMFNTIINSNELLTEEVKNNNINKKELINSLKLADSTIEDDNIESNIVADQEAIIKKHIEQNSVVDTVTYKNKYDNIPKEEVVSKSPSIETLTDNNLKELEENGKLDKKKYEKLTTLVKETLNKPSPFKDGTKIKDNLVIEEKELEMSKSETKLPDNKLVYDKETLHDPISVRNKKYLSTIYKKDLISSIMDIQGSGMLVEDISIEPHDDNLGTYDEYSIKLNDLGKTAGSTVKLMIPRVEEDGTFTISGNQYILRLQKADIVIKKINFNRVSLSTAYGKLFVNKAPYKKQDRGYDLKKKLLMLSNDGKISNFSAGSINVSGVTLPTDYTLFGRYVKSFKINSYYFNFNYDGRKELIKNDKFKLDTIEHDGKYVVCGYTTKGVIVMDIDNMLYLYDGKYNKLSTIWDIVPIDVTTLKKEYSMVKIFKNYIPVAYLLTYYMGIENMLKTLNVKYELLDGNKRVDTSNNEVVVKLDGSTLVMYPDNKTNSMILEGFNNDPKILKQMTFSMLNHKEQFMFLFKEMGLNLVSITEIKAIESLFIDPVSRTILEEMHEPTTFIGLLIRSSELLIDDNYIHPNSLKGYTIKGYERIPQLIYKALAAAIKQKMSGDTFGRAKIVVNPYTVWKSMNEDSSGVLVDDLNPVALLKQLEDTTLLGAGGRSKESIVGKARAMHEDDIGVISESSKDSSDVGITAYLSANPKIANVRGIKDDDGKLSWSNVLSTSAMLYPFSLTDDPKRVLYANIQNSHLTAIKNAEVYPVRTGYESVLPYRMGKKFIGVAEDDGKVLKVTKNRITVEYKTLGKKSYTFKDWTTKEESNMAYIQKMVSNLEDNEKILKDDILYYNSGFFDVDMFNKHRVVYRASTNANIALMESRETYEDSIMVGDKLSSGSVINYIKVRDLTLNNTETITNLIEIGKQVSPTDPLFIISTGLEENENMSKETLDLLQGFVKTTPKAKYRGKLLKVKVYYNCEKKELSRSIRKLVDISEEYMDGKSGQVNSGYSINGKPLEYGKVHIKFYISVEGKLGVGDKGIVGAQLKTTVANVYTDPILTDDGTEVDAIFSLKGLYARIVNSVFLMGTTATVLDKLTKNAVDMYFGKD